MEQIKERVKLCMKVIKVIDYKKTNEVEIHLLLRPSFARLVMALRQLSIVTHVQSDLNISETFPPNPLQRILCDVKF